MKFDLNYFEITNKVSGLNPIEITWADNSKYYQNYFLMKKMFRGIIQL